MTTLRRALATIPRRPLTILLADAQGESREALARDLERDGALVVAVGDGDAAIDRLLSERFRPDVVISGARMPHRNGVELYEELRAAGLTTPFILLTRAAERIDSSALAESGVAVVLPRPVSFDQLRAAIGDVVSRARHVALRNEEASR